VSTLNLAPPSPEIVVVHSGVVVSMLHLLPAIHSSEHSQFSMSLQMFAAEIIRSLVRSERNQQVSCRYINLTIYLLTFLLLMMVEAL